MRHALADKPLLGAALTGPSWSTWHAFLIALVGEKLQPSERQIFSRWRVALQPKRRDAPQCHPDAGRVFKSTIDGGTLNDQARRVAAQAT